MSIEEPRVSFVLACSTKDEAVGQRDMLAELLKRVGLTPNGDLPGVMVKIRYQRYLGYVIEVVDERDEGDAAIDLLRRELGRRAGTQVHTERSARRKLPNGRK